MAETAVILTVGNEIVSGDVENTNASWLARRLAELGVEVTAPRGRARRHRRDRGLPPRRARAAAHVFVTGGLGGTPGRHHPRGGRGRLRGALRGDRLARRRAARPLLPARARRLRGALGLPPGRRGAAREPARRRPGLRARERLRPAGPAERDGGDVRGDRRAVRGNADRQLAPELPDRRGPDRRGARGGHDALSRGDRRELPALPRDGPGGRGRPEVGGARALSRRRSSSSRRARSRGVSGPRARAPARPRSRRGARRRGGSTRASRRGTAPRGGRRGPGRRPRSRRRQRSAPSPSPRC